MSRLQGLTQTPPFNGPSFKVAIVGCGGVGKSALTIQFVQNYFITDYDPTIEDSYVKICQVDGVSCKISDTAGQEEFQTMRDSFMKSCEGFMLVFSFLDKNSLEALRSIHKQILRVKDRDEFPMVLVGNKCDVPHEARMVTSEQGKALARELRLHYVETSAKLRLHIEQAFYDIVRLIRKFHEEERPLPVIKPRKRKGSCVIL